MDQYTVTGMSCSACSAHVEKAVSKVPGVTSCTVSLLTNSMSVEGSASSDDIIRAVQDAGYGASRKNRSADAAGNASAGSMSLAEQEEALADHETPLLRRRLIASVVFLIALMYISMGYMMWGWPLPAWFENNHIAVGLAELLLCAIIMVINQKFFISGFKGLIHGAPNMDTLVSLGSAASFVWSVYALFMMTGAFSNGDMDLGMSFMDEFYFESAAMILTLITVGKMLEAHSRGRTTDALKSLMKLAPKTATVIRDGVTEEAVPVAEVKKGDIFVVRPGESIPVDGIIIDGSSAVNEAALTGESIPADKSRGDMVSAATVNQSGFIRCEATRVGEDTTLSQIIKMVSDAAATKAPIAKIADKVSGVFVPVVITIAVITMLVWLIAGREFGYALSRGISVLVISCPCALGLATPVAIMVGNGMGAKNGILFKTAVSLEETGKVQIIVLDKTGTVTRGEPEVTDILPAENVAEKELLRCALTLEKKSEHPLAKAVLRYCSEKSINSGEVSDFKALPGNGLSGVLDDDSVTKLLGGSMQFIGSRCEVPDKMKEAAQKFAEAGKTPLLFTADDNLLGIIAVADVIKEDSQQAVRELKNMGIRVVMLTGDNERTARAIGAQAGVDDVIAQVLPDGKENVIRRLKETGTSSLNGKRKKEKPLKVAMVGDGINDAPALTCADIGIAIGAGSDVAIDAADVVLMNSRLSDVPAAIRLSRATLRNIHENLFWAFFYNIIGIPLAAGVWIPIFGWTLNPMFGAAAMSLSSFFVVSNALRLNLFKIRDASHDKKINSAEIDMSVFSDRITADSCKNENMNIMEEMKMIKTTMHVEGMMCEMCENHVNNAIRKTFDVKEVTSSHTSGITEIISEEVLDEEKLKAAVEEAGYKPQSVSTETI